MLYDAEVAIRAAAVYLRISSDREGDHLGVGRQRTDCLELAERNGWTIAEVYEDNDVSAWSGVRRPEFERMLGDITDRSRDAVIVYDQDRLTRQPRDFERFLDVCDDAGMDTIATVSGSFDLSTTDGRCMARMLAAMNRKSSDDTARRIRRKHQELASEGKVSGGGTRPFGYTTDRRSIEPAEAAVIKEAVARVLGGDSVRSICADFDERGIRTVTGKTWNPSVMAKMLCSARISGQREHNGVIVGPAEWPAIITPKDTARLREAIGAGRRHASPAPRRYLLAGILRCGLCGATLVSRPRADGTRQYVCAKGPGHAGCGQLSVRADPLELLIVDAVTARLDTPQFAKVVEKGISQNHNAAALSDQIAQDEALVNEFAAMLGRREMTHAEWAAARNEPAARITAAKKKLSRLSGTTALDGYVGNGEQLRAKWDGLDLARAKAIVAAVMDHAVIAPAIRGRNRFDEDRVTPVWKR